ncbi:MAG: M23 family metallopeptidase [Bacteroidetes bacterium]|nr:M23 family metallopeptidase [Bacteroidota bacterium]
MKLRLTPLYKFSPEALAFVKVKWGRTKIMLMGVLVCIIFLSAVYGINQYYGDILGLAYLHETTLVYENKILREQLKYLTKKINDVQKIIAQVSDKGNELRLLVNLPKLEIDIQKVGVGGIEENVELTSSSEINDMLNNLQFLVSKLEREVMLQRTSYDEVAKMYEKNRTMFEHLPAIKPADGYFSPNSYGIRLHPILRIYRMHEGIDIVNEIGTPVYATGNGVVSFAGRQIGLGLTIEINHGYSIKTIYGHLSKILVHEGQSVKRGDLIGRIGNSGLSSGPHLHYEVRINGVAQNPIDYFFNDIHPVSIARK